MSTFLHPGVRSWGLSIDQDGHRTYNVSFLTEGDPTDGPANHAQTPGLPLMGDIWVIRDDVDVWAWFRAGPTEVKDLTSSPGAPPRRGANDNTLFEMSFTASTRPSDAGGPGGSGGRDDKGARKKCSDQRIEDPLSEPPATSGGSVRYQREEEYDQNGRMFRYTSFEKVLGSLREFDAHREQVIVEQNVFSLDRSLVRALMDKLNDSVMWDMPARCWKLCDCSWQRKLYGTCSFYYTRRLVLESNAVEIPADHRIFTLADHPLRPYLQQGPDAVWWLPMWDHYALDESSKVLNGHWHWLTSSWILNNIPVGGATPPDPNNPAHYMQAVDRWQNPTRVVLSKDPAKKGQPAVKMGADGDDDFNWVALQRYQEENLLQLGLPVTL